MMPSKAVVYLCALAERACIPYGDERGVRSSSRSCGCALGTVRICELANYYKYMVGLSCDARFIRLHIRGMNSRELIDRVWGITMGTLGETQRYNIVSDVIIRRRSPQNV